MQVITCNQNRVLLLNYLLTAKLASTCTKWQFLVFAQLQWSFSSSGRESIYQACTQLKRTSTGSDNSYFRATLITCFIWHHQKHTARIKPIHGQTFSAAVNTQKSRRKDASAVHCDLSASLYCVCTWQLRKCRANSSVGGHFYSLACQVARDSISLGLSSQKKI